MVALICVNSCASKIRIKRCGRTERIPITRGIYKCFQTYKVKRYKLPGFILTFQKEKNLCTVRFYFALSIGTNVKWKFLFVLFRWKDIDTVTFYFALSIGHKYTMKYFICTFLMERYIHCQVLLCTLNR